MTSLLPVEKLLTDLGEQIEALTDLNSSKGARLDYVNGSLNDFFLGIDSKRLSAEETDLKKINSVFNRMHSVGKKKAKKLKLIYSPPEVRFEKGKDRKVRIRLFMAEIANKPAPEHKGESTTSEKKAAFGPVLRPAQQEAAEKPRERKAGALTDSDRYRLATAALQMSERDMIYYDGIVAKVGDKLYFRHENKNEIGGFRDGGWVGWRLGDTNKVSSDAVIGYTAVIRKDVTIGNKAVINDRVTIDEGTQLGNYVRVGTGTHIGKGVQVGKQAFIEEDCV